ncbi:MAG TPA: TonB family protein [Candidatus Sulfotelmatobacter sp.]|nr:TonB family protein [Candidatus Sulfotelmatobacter sp.]
MSPTLELEEAVHTRDDTPKLLVKWSSRWEEFVGSIQPALTRSEARLAGEAPFGLIPLRIMVPSYVLEACLIAAAIFVKVKIDELQPYVAPRISSHDVIYYSGDELPRTQDLGGAEAGRTGEAGGEEARHRTQTIKVARGGSLVPKVVDAPNLKLPSSSDAVANLLAIRPDPGRPPAEGLRSTRSTPNLTATLAPPAPNVIRDYTRNGVRLDPVIAPAPSVTRDQPLTAPNLNTTLVPPAPNVSTGHTLVAPALAPAVIPPAAVVSRDHPLLAPALDPSVAPPTENVRRDPFRAGPVLAANMVPPPAPAALSRQLSAAPIQTMDPSAVPPPVSAPERADVRRSKLNLPAPAVVAPPTSTDVTADMRRLTGATPPDPSKAVAPPPPSASASGSLMSNLIGRIFGPTEVVAPPPTSVNAKGTSSASRPTLPDNVAPPPASVSAEGGGSPRGNRNGAGASLAANVVAPPPSVGLNGGMGTPSRKAAAPYVGNPSVVPAPPALAGAGGGTGKSGGAAGADGGRLLADNVVPPPPSVGAGTTTTGSGLGRKGPGLGAPLDAGSRLTPATNSGSGKDAGTVMSSQPGTKIGVPPDPKTGLLAMSPAGGEKPGLGGAGGGTGIGRGSGPGSGMTGAGTGAGKTGAARGSDPNAHAGISPSNGPGGAGSIPTGNPAVPGVDISGGNGIVTLPSFGSDPSGNSLATPGRSSVSQQKKTLGVTIVATAGSAGAFEPYKNLLRGDKSITYLDTTLGTLVMEFSDEANTTHAFGGDLTAPAALRSDLPEGLPRARMVVTCKIDASGDVKNLRVLEPGPAQMTANVLAALRTWKFQPAMRNNRPLEVTAILGFGIDTSDHF